MASDPTGGNEEIALESAEEENETQKCLSGFIFMCNQKTKVECYQYRVFGLPFGQRQVLGGIKPGAKLFLYDFESKLLYGIYEATSAGMLDKEPAAFGGKFPAQVGFSIFKECLPLPESNLRHIIKENYSGWKFKQELSAKQVKTLSSSFQPLNPSEHAHQATPIVSQFHGMPHFARKTQYKQTETHPYSTERQYSRTSQYQAATVPDVHYPPQGYHKTKYEMALVEQLSHQSSQRKGGYEATNSQQSYLPRGVPSQVQEPNARNIIQRAPHDQVINTEPQYRDDIIRYSSNQQSASTQYPSSVTQSSSINHISSVFRSVLAEYASQIMQPDTTQYISTVVQPASAQYSSSAMPPPSAYYTSPVAATAQYDSSAMQPASAYYNRSYNAASAQYDSSTTHLDSAYYTSSVIQPASAYHLSSVVQPASAQYASSMQPASTQYASLVGPPASAQYTSSVMQPDSGYYTASVTQPAYQY